MKCRPRARGSRLELHRFPLSTWKLQNEFLRMLEYAPFSFTCLYKGHNSTKTRVEISLNRHGYSYTIDVNDGIYIFERGKRGENDTRKLEGDSRASSKFVVPLASLVPWHRVDEIAREMANVRVAVHTYLFFSAQADPPRRARVAPTPARDRFDPRSRWSCRRSSRKHRGKLGKKTRSTHERETGSSDGRWRCVWRDNSRLFTRAQTTASPTLSQVEKRRGTKARACVLFLYRSADDGDSDGDGGDDGDDGVGEGNGGRHSRAWHGGKGEGA